MLEEAISPRAGTLAMDLNDRVNTIEDRADFAAFLRELLTNLRQEPSRWENCDLRSYLGAMAAWAEDMDGYYENRGESMPEQPSWRTLGELLLAARVYE